MARAFVPAGMKVAVADVEERALEALEAEFSDGDLICLKVDVTNRQDMTNARDQVIDTFGRVHILCNNAGVAVGGHVAQMSFPDWDWAMGVNLNGVINGVATFLPHMIEHGEGGHVVNTASIAGLIVMMPSRSVYHCSKFAVVGLSESMRLDLATDGIGVSVLCPGVVRTDIYTSERNRPDGLRGENDSRLLVSQDMDAEQQAEAIETRLVGAMPASVIGDMVLHAIQHDESYIFSHDFKPQVDARAQKVARSFEVWNEYLKTHAQQQVDS